VCGQTYAFEAGSFLGIKALFYPPTATATATAGALWFPCAQM